MNTKVFLTILIFLSAIVAATLLGFQQLESLSAYAPLSWISYLFFVVFSLVMFWGGQRSATSDNKLLFSQFFLAATVVKMLLSLTMVLVYFLLEKPTTQFFIIPFFFVYLCFTVFEVYFMTKLGKAG